MLALGIILFILCLLYLLVLVYRAYQVEERATPPLPESALDAILSNKQTRDALRARITQMDAVDAQLSARRNATDAS